MKKIVLLTVMTILTGNSLCCMEAEKTGELASNLSTLPKELRRYIISLFLQCHLGSPKYECIKQINVDYVKFFALSPDGKIVLVGEYGRTVRLWDRETGTEVQRLSENNDWIHSAVFSPDGKTVLTGSKTARLWDVETGKQLKQFTGHKDSINSAAFSPDGKYILTGSRDYTACLWDVETGNKLQELGHKGTVSSVAFSLDGKTVLTGSSITAHVWDLETGQEIQKFSGHTNIIRSVAFSPDGKTILTGSSDKTARLWYVRTGIEIQQFTELSSFYAEEFTVAFSPDGETVLTGSSNSRACLWSLSTGKEIQALNTSGIFTVAAFNKDGTIVLGDSSGMVSFWRSNLTLPLPLTLKQKEEAYALFKSNTLYAILRDEPLVIEEQKSFDENSLSSGFDDSYPIGSWVPWSDRAIFIGNIGVCVFSLALYVLLKNK